MSKYMNMRTHALSLSLFFAVVAFDPHLVLTKVADMLPLGHVSSFDKSLLQFWEFSIPRNTSKIYIRKCFMTTRMQYWEVCNLKRRL